MPRILPIAAGAGLATIALGCSISSVAAQPAGSPAPLRHEIAWHWRSEAGVPIAPIDPGAPATAAAWSALLPGTGQLVLGRSRGWGYLALETIGWLAYVDRRRAGADFPARYRDLAWTEARLQAGARVDGDFAYYETLSHWTRSGLFDIDPGIAGTQPESDIEAYNGWIWSLATGIFDVDPGAGPSDPGYPSAIEYYEERAYGGTFLWDWTGSGTAQEEFADLIRESDDRYRQATNVLGAIIANHVVSTVDAFLTGRGVDPPVDAALLPWAGPAGVRWGAAFRVPLTRGASVRRR